jgi:peptidoglycan-associated lipoprotein
MARSAPSRRVAAGTVLLLLAALAGAADRPMALRRSELPPAVYFDPNSTALRADAIPVIRQWAAYLMRGGSEETVRLQGHADQRGTPDYNAVLAEQRALAVLRALVALGVESDRLEVVSAGEHSPQAFGHDEFAWSRNRRVELELE